MSTDPDPPPSPAHAPGGGFSCSEDSDVPSLPDRESSLPLESEHAGVNLSCNCLNILGTAMRSKCVHSLNFMRPEKENEL
jgi:hypothetical protein